tara:strand:- start:372 stop:527 length:156 start_codon:yes stop_codon:yes gene_type:complete
MNMLEIEKLISVSRKSRINPINKSGKKLKKLNTKGDILSKRNCDTVINIVE